MDAFDEAEAKFKRGVRTLDYPLVQEALTDCPALVGSNVLEAELDSLVISESLLIKDKPSGWWYVAEPDLIDRAERDSRLLKLRQIFSFILTQPLNTYEIHSGLTWADTLVVKNADNIDRIAEVVTAFIHDRARDAGAPDFELNYGAIYLYYLEFEPELSRSSKEKFYEHMRAVDQRVKERLASPTSPKEMSLWADHVEVVDRWLDREMPSLDEIPDPSAEMLSRFRQEGEAMQGEEDDWAEGFETDEQFLQVYMAICGAKGYAPGSEDIERELEKFRKARARKLGGSDQAGGNEEDIWKNMPDLEM